MLHMVWDITVQSLVNLYSEQKFETAFSGKIYLKLGPFLKDLTKMEGLYHMNFG